MNDPKMITPLPADLETCAQEPIRIPGSIQPHGALLVLSEPDLRILQASRNIGGLIGIEPEALLGRPLSGLLPDFSDAEFRRRLGTEDLYNNPLYVLTLRLGAPPRSFTTLVHRTKQALILELEAAATVDDLTFRNLYTVVRGVLAELQTAGNLLELCERAAREVRRLTKFDRVMIYRFDKDWNGQVVTEDKAESMQSFLQHYFPASDIPAQARELYLRNRLRLIVDASYTPAPMTPAAYPPTGKPLDMSFCTLRSVSPVHIEYLRNMGVAASMSISLVENNRLWGLIACHHPTPRQLPYEIRTACELIGQTLSLQVFNQEFHRHAAFRLTLNATQSNLLTAMAQEEDYLQGLLRAEPELLRFMNAQGAAVCFDEQCHFLGNTPQPEQVRELINWLVQRQQEELIVTDRLAELYPPAAAYQDKAAGILAIAISRIHPRFIIWFRPEVVQTIQWGGNPAKAADMDASSYRIHPRKSFEQWKQTVRGRSLPWHTAEAEAAADFRSAVVSIVLRKAEEFAQLAAELERSNRELEAFSYSVSHDLRAPFRHIQGFTELLRSHAAERLDPTAISYIDTIARSAEYAGTLVDSLLSLSRIGRTELRHAHIDMRELVVDAIRSLRQEIGERQVNFEVGDLPAAEGDLMMLRLVWRNLLSNAVKYTARTAKAKVVVSGRTTPAETIYQVQDNGVGFDMRYVHKLFGVFQRLHRGEDFEGTGIGLANVRRIIERHGGRVWAEGIVNEGATFSFALPSRVQERNP